MPTSFHHSIRKRCLLAVGLIALLWTSGCAWDPGRLNLNKYRDDRAVEMDGRLSTRPPIVDNPFEQVKTAK